MCSIIKATSKEMLEKLVDLNQEKGTFSHSISAVRNNQIYWIAKNYGLFDKASQIIDMECDYYLAHVQAPTGGLVKDNTRIHPATYRNVNLYHNGLLKNTSIAKLKLDSKSDFDTYLLAKAIYTKGFDVLSEVEGSFACIALVDGKFYMFRTKHSKLYVDDNGNVSSEKLNDDFKCINYDTIYDENLNVVGSFKTKSFNFVIKGEL